MQSVVRSIFILFLLGFFTVASAQLSPKVMADKYRIQVGQLLEKEDYKAAFNMVEKIIALQKEHRLTLADEFYFKDTIEQLLGEKNHVAVFNMMDKFIALQKGHSLTLPNEFHFQYAQIAFSTGSFQTAVDAVKKYLATAGKKGQFYKEALALLNKAEQAKQIIPIEPEMVVIPSGHLLMEDVPGVTRSVNIDSFALSKYEVTFEEYDRFTDATGREYASDWGFGRGRRPVIAVSWHDAAAYTQWLSSQTGKSYRLPSEAEWEYAARAGTKTMWGRTGRGNCEGCGSGIEWKDKRTVPVGSYEGNAWGVHNMLGNVSEWVQDCANGNYRGASTEGSAWEYGDCFERLVGGGSWVSNLIFMYRHGRWVAFRSEVCRPYVGFRVARSF